MVWRTRLHQGGIWINNELSAAVSAEKVHGKAAQTAQTGVRLRKNARKRGESLLQGLKPVESALFTSALKHRPPKEKTFSAA
jgi:hypothetical protein